MAADGSAGGPGGESGRKKTIGSGAGVMFAADTRDSQSKAPGDFVRRRSTLNIKNAMDTYKEKMVNSKYSNFSRLYVVYIIQIYFRF